MPVVSSTALFNTLQCYPCQSYVLAYSGGMDSHVLLHLLATLRQAGKIAAVRAIYIDHGLQHISSTWAIHCQNTAQALRIPCQTVALNLQIKANESLEAIAREARYQVFAEHLKTDEILLTAHHQNDQAETVLLQLFRGAGVNGLAAMPVIKPFSKGQLLRPLLDYSRDELAHYATQQQLHYIDDPSNLDTQFDRNFLRQTVLPLLQTRWKGINVTLSRVAKLQAESKYLLAENTALDLQQVQGKHNHTLNIAALAHFSTIRQKAIIRFWLQQLHIRMPSAIKLQHILSDVLYAKQDAKPCVHWEHAEIRRYQGQLYALPRLDAHNTQQIIPWDTLTEDLYIDSLKQTIPANTLQKLLQQRNQSAVVTAAISIRFRQGGEKIILTGKKSPKSLKRLLYDAHIPPWERDRIPLIYFGEELIMVYPYWSSEK